VTPADYARVRLQIDWLRIVTGNSGQLFYADETKKCRGQ